MEGKHLSHSAIGSLRIWRETVNEVQDPVAPCPPCLIPQPVSQDTSSHSQTERGEEAQLPGRCKGSSRNQKPRRRYGQTYLTREDGGKQYGVALPYDELEDRVHRF